MPRTSAEQATTGTEVAGGLANAQPGDLVFFGSPVHHVGIYAGNGMMVEAPHTGTKVQVHSIDATPSHVRRITLPVTALGRCTGGRDRFGHRPSRLAGRARRHHHGHHPRRPRRLASLGSGRPDHCDERARCARCAAVRAGVGRAEPEPAGVAARGRGQGRVRLQPHLGQQRRCAGAHAADARTPQQASAPTRGTRTSAANGAAKLLRGYIDKYNSVPLALAAYNAGPGAVAKYGGIPPYAETQAYVQRVSSLAAAA